MAEDNNTSNQRQSSGLRGKPGDPLRKKPKFNIMWVYAVIVLGIFAIATLNKGGKAKEVDFRQFREEMLKTGAVDKLVVVNNETLNALRWLATPLAGISRRRGCAILHL